LCPRWKRPSVVFIDVDDKIKFQKLEKLFVIGYFEGDKKQDTVFEHNFSRLTGTEMTIQ
jgi:hypothetical protein